MQRPLPGPRRRRDRHGVDLTDPRPRHVDDDTGYWWTGGFDDHLDEITRRHIRRVVLATEEMLRTSEMDGLVMGASDETAAALTAALPAHVAARVLGRISLRVAAPASAVVEPVADLIDGRERNRRLQLVENVRGRLALGSATMGLADSLRALREWRVGVLLVERGYRAAARCCDRCGLLTSTHVGPCPCCPGRLVDDGNVIPDAVVSAVRQHAEVVALDPGTLGGTERVATLCRY